MKPQHAFQGKQCEMCLEGAMFPTPEGVSDSYSQSKDIFKIAVFFTLVLHDWV